LRGSLPFAIVSVARMLAGSSASASGHRSSTGRQTPRRPRLPKLVAITASLESCRRLVESSRSSAWSGWSRPLPPGSSTIGRGYGLDSWARSSALPGPSWSTSGGSRSSAARQMVCSLSCEGSACDAGSCTRRAEAATQAQGDSPLPRSTSEPRLATARGQPDHVAIHASNDGATLTIASIAIEPRRPKSPSQASRYAEASVAVQCSPNERLLDGTERGSGSSASTCSIRFLHAP
jgi:hypothetical protein